jgi:type VI protein secretion system component VasA
MNFFEEELKTLKEAKKEFDNTYSDAELNIAPGQILYGLAALTARIREEMAETENEIAHDFAERVAPELMLPLPARSLAEIAASPSDNLKREIPSGSLLSFKGRNSNEKPFFWQVIGKHKLNPAQKIISVKALEDSEGFDCLEFESNGDGPWIIYINGESEFAWKLWYFMLEFAKPHIIAKPQNPWELCRDFFCFEEKFRYIYMEKLPHKLRFAKKIPKEIFSEICTENFKLNVLPIENAFEQNLELVLLEDEAFEAKIFPNEKRQRILFLKEVLAGNAKKTNFERIEYRYSSGKIRFKNFPENADMLSVCAYVCDGNSAILEKGNILQSKNSAMQMCEIRSITESLCFLPCRTCEWTVFGLLQKNYLRFFEGDALKNALEMQLWNSQGKRNYLARSIKSVFLENKNAVYKNCLVPMASVTITLNADSFDNQGIFFAYGEMLFYLFKKIFVCNMLVSLILRIEPARVELKWE